MRRIIDDTLFCFGAESVDMLSKMMITEYVAKHRSADSELGHISMLMAIDYLSRLLRLTLVAACKNEATVNLVDSELSGAELWEDTFQTEDVDHDFFQFADELLFSKSFFEDMEKILNRVLGSLTTLTSSPCFGLFVTVSSLYHDLSLGNVKFWLLETKDVEQFFTGGYGSPELFEVYRNIPPRRNEGVLYVVDGFCFPEAVIEDAGIVVGQEVKLFVIKQEVMDLINKG